MRIKKISSATNSSGISDKIKPITAEDDRERDSWLEEFYKSVESKVADKFQGMNWNSDDENVYLDISTDDDRVVQFTIPFEDLSFNFDKMDESVNYVIDEIESEIPVESSVNSAYYPDGTEYDPEDYAGGYTEWDKIVSKPVRDSDGFMTEYTMWYNSFNDKYVFIFGDPDIYYPENADFDWECEDYDEAVEWWNDYNGFEDDEDDEIDEDDEDDEIEECNNIVSSENPRSGWTATDVVRNMYSSFPEVEFIDERDHGDDVYLYFKYTSKFPGNKEHSLMSYLKSSGLKYHVRDGQLVIIAPEDENYEESGEDEIEECTNSKIESSISPKAAMKINKAAWGDEAVEVVLNQLSDKLEGYDSYGEYFDVSYVGETGQLLDEIYSVLREAGLEPQRYSDNEICYDNSGMQVIIRVVPDDDASTYSEDSTGYFIYVDNVDNYESDYEEWGDSPVDECQSITSSESGELVPYVVRFGWDSGGPESGPRYGYGEDIVYAISEDDACKKWEEENEEQIESFNNSKYGGYEGCFAHVATDNDIQKYEEEKAYWEELESMYDFVDGDVIPKEGVKSSEEFFDKGEGATYWYFTTHGVQPGSVPKGLEILDVVDRPEGSYFLTDKVLTTDSLKYYDIKERAPKGVTSCDEPVKAWYTGEPDPAGMMEGNARYRMNKPIDMDKVWEIAERYNTSKPVSGDWSTEATHEMNAIAEELDIPKSRAKKIMIEELGFDEEMFR